MSSFLHSLFLFLFSDFFSFVSYMMQMNRKEYIIIEVDALLLLHSCLLYQRRQIHINWFIGKTINPTSVCCSPGSENLGRIRVRFSSEPRFSSGFEPGSGLLLEGWIKLWSLSTRIQNSPPYYPDISDIFGTGPVP